MMRSSKMSLQLKIFVFVFFWHFLLWYYSSLNLVKIPWNLGNWFSRNSILSDCKNNRKTKKLCALFGYIFKLVFASSDSFCLITSHVTSNDDDTLLYLDFTPVTCYKTQEDLAKQL